VFHLSAAGSVRQRLRFDVADFPVDAAGLAAGNNRRADYLHKQQK